MRSGFCLWLRPGWRYTATQQADHPVASRFIHFVLTDSEGRLYPDDAPLPPEYIEAPDPALMDATTRRIVERCHGFAMGRTDPPFGKDIAEVAEALLTGLLMELDAVTDGASDYHQPRFPPHYMQVVRQAIGWIGESPFEPKSVAELARRSSYSVSNFSRIFTLVTGQSPQHFSIRTRLSHSKRLLRDTDMPVGEIAISSGYRDVYFFSRQFKSFHGISPTKFRQQHRAGLAAVGDKSKFDKRCVHSVTNVIDV